MAEIIATIIVMLTTKRQEESSPPSAAPPLSAAPHLLAVILLLLLLPVPEWQKHSPLLYASYVLPALSLLMPREQDAAHHMQTCSRERETDVSRERQSGAEKTRAENKGNL
jgi:hypothetical protein